MIGLETVKECMALYESTIAELQLRWLLNDAGIETLDPHVAVDLTERLVTSCEGGAMIIDQIEEALKRVGRDLPQSLKDARSSMNNASAKWRKSCEDMSARGGDETVTQH